MKDDPKSNIQFVKLVEKFPVLYDVRVDGYSRKEAQDKAWNSVAAAMKDTVPNCKEKWRNIRTCLTRHLRQSKDRQKSSGKLRRPYYLAPYMTFLIPFTKTRIVAHELSIPCDDTPDPLRDDSDHVAMSDYDVDCLKPRIVDVQGEAAYEISYPREVRRACPKEEEEEAITEEEEDDEEEDEEELVIEVGEEDAIEVVEEEDEEERAEGGRKGREEEGCRKVEEEGCRKGEEEEGCRKKAAEAGDEPKRRRKGEDASVEALKVAAGGLNTIRINHFDGKNARISVERSPSPSNADMDFFRSILPELSGMSRSQKSSFRISVLKSLHELLYDS